MTFVLGRDDGAGPDQEPKRDDRPAGLLGHHRAPDGSDGAPLSLDLDRPHAALVVGKRGYGKSYTLGVLAEELAETAGVAPVLVDPVGVFGTLAATGGPPATVVADPTVAPDAVDPRSWCTMLGLSPTSGAGALVWRAAAREDTLDGMRAFVADADAPSGDVRAALNHLDLAASWDVFDEEGLTAAGLCGAETTVLDVSELDGGAANAVVRGVAETLYRARVDRSVDRLPWLLVDEAQVFFDGVAASALETVARRGRRPGVSLVLATQRPSAVPETTLSQTDLRVVHRLTTRQDVDALDAVTPRTVRGSLADRLPTEPGEVLVVDDDAETCHAATVRERRTPHDGESPRASAVGDDRVTPQNPP